MTTLQIGDSIKVTVQKYDPSVDDAPYYKTYTVPYAKEMRVLETLDYVVEELGESIAYQWSCGIKKCGMCAIKVNGRPIMGCWEPAQREMVLEPIDQFPVIRDLVVDRSQYTENLMAMDPFLNRGDDDYIGFPEHITSGDMEHSARMAYCIECLLCNSVCPSYGSEFVGPAPLVQLARWALDPRDRSNGQRALTSIEAGGIENCVSCYECTQVCPTGIPVLEWAIDGLRKQIVENEIGTIAHHNKVYMDLTREQGLVNPSTLLVRSKGLKVIADLPMAIRMWRRGRLSISKVLKGMLGGDKLETQDELFVLEKAVDEIDWRAE
jgi:succinate dehydrogenase/fumarate reductase iron-sulfur protein